VYDKTLNDVHRFTVQLGIEATSAKTTGANNKTFGYLKFRGEGFASVPLTYTPVGRTTLDNDLYGNYANYYSLFSRLFIL
jgi:hypothetical protein